MTCLFKPLSGILRQRTYLPIRYMPLTFELSLVDLVSDPIITRPTAYDDIDGDNVNLTAANLSTDWSITNVQVKCDLVALDIELNESLKNIGRRKNYL